jgi:hypothetical protein
MQMKIEPKTPTLLLIFMVAAILLVTCIIAMQAFFLGQFQQEEEMKFAQNPNTTLLQSRGEQIQRISTYRWIDRQKQIVAIPIDDAMKLLVQRKEEAK